VSTAARILRTTTDRSGRGERPCPGARATGIVQYLAEAPVRLADSAGETVAAPPAPEDEVVAENVSVPVVPSDGIDPSTGRATVADSRGDCR
jgi:hypothetical protein